MPDDTLPHLAIDAAPTAARLAAEAARLLAAIPAARLRGQRWYGSKGQAVAGLHLRDVAPLGDRLPAVLALVDVALCGGAGETYYLPLAARPPAEAAALLGHDLAGAFLALDTPSGAFPLYDACLDAEVNREVFRRIARGERLAARGGAFVFAPAPALADDVPPEPVRRLGAEQSNTSVVFGDTYVLKVFRKLANGVNPDLEVARFLTTRTAFRHTPPLAGSVEYTGADFAAAIGALQTFVANTGDGWQYTQAHLATLYRQAQRLGSGAYGDEHAARALVAAFSAEYLQAARRLGEITGELHAALASDPADPTFAPEAVTPVDLGEWVTGMEAHLAMVLAKVAAAAEGYPPAEREQLRRVAAAAPWYRERLRGLLALADVGLEKIRHHGDYHLGQVLRTADGFVVLDFEGEPARPLALRRAKHLALRDVAGMLRSFDYALYAGLFALRPAAADWPALERVGHAWEGLAVDAYLDGYLAQTFARSASFLPRSLDLIRRTTAVFLLDKAIYELGYEIDNRPDWLRIPLQYVAGLLPPG